MNILHQVRVLTCEFFSHSIREVNNSHISAEAIRTRIAQVGTTQEDLAAQLGMSPAWLNYLLTGRRKPKPDFGPRAMAALDKLERAELAADKARQKVLGKGAVA